MPGIITAEEIAQLVVEKLTEKGVLIPRLLTLEMASTYMGMTKDALKYKALDGQIPTVRIDKKYRFDREDLDRYIEAHKVAFRDEGGATISAPIRTSNPSPETSHGPSRIGDKPHRFGRKKTREDKRNEERY
jgi:excisionase family DNA binding protein